MRFQRRRTVTPVIAELLMTAVAVAMSVIIFMWSQGFLSQTSSATGGQQGSQNQAAQSSIAVEMATFNAGTGTGGAACTASSIGSPKIAVAARNVGAVEITLGSMTIQGISSNSGFKGSITISSVSSTSATATGVSNSDGSTAWQYLTSAATASKGGFVTIDVCNTATSALTNTQIAAGDVISIKQTTSVGTFAQSQFTVP